MTPTPERVRELLALWPANVASADRYDLFLSRVIAEDVKAILADWLRLVAPAQSCPECPLGPGAPCNEQCLAPTPSAQAKCGADAEPLKILSGRYLMPDGSVQMKPHQRAVSGGIVPPAPPSAQAREALERIERELRRMGLASEPPALYMIHEMRDWARDALRSLSANVGGGGGLGGAVDSQWRDIATAPRDGTRIMLGVVCKSASQIGKEPDFYHLAQWCGDHWSPFVPNEWTHWQPLQPLPPAPVSA